MKPSNLVIMFFIEIKIIWIKKTKLMIRDFLKILSYLECWNLKKKVRNIIQKTIGVKLNTFLEWASAKKMPLAFELNFDFFNNSKYVNSFKSISRSDLVCFFAFFLLNDI